MNQDNFSHNRLQQECFNYLWNTYPILRRKFWHTPNESPRLPNESITDHRMRIAKSKAIGVLPGVLDLVLYFRGILYIFDVKLPGDSIKPAQRSFIDAIISEQGQFFEINNLADFKAYIDEIMKSHGIERKAEKIR